MFLCARDLLQNLYKVDTLLDSERYAEMELVADMTSLQARRILAATVYTGRVGI